MRIHKTQYATWGDEELLKLAEFHNFDSTEVGLELMERLADHIDVTKEALAEVQRINQVLDDYVDSH